MKTFSMVKGTALSYDESNQFIGGRKAREEEQTYDGGTLDTVVVTAEKIKKAF